MRFIRTLPALAGALALAGCSSGAHSGAAGSSSASLEPERSLTTDVRSLLSAYEQVPNKDAWLRLGSGTPAVLEQIANDGEEMPSRRARALEVLGWFGEAGVPVIQRYLGDSNAPAAVRAGAVTGVARALPASDAVSLLSKSLNDADPMVRFRTVLELQHLATPEARAALQARAAVETDGSVNRVLTKALASEQPKLPTVPGNLPGAAP